MGTGIEWTDATWNPVVGCERVSPGCDHCYAIGTAHRALQPAHTGLTVRSAGERPDWTGEVRCLPERLLTPLRWRRPLRIFVNSMSDLFHPALPATFIARVFAVMAATPRHSYQILTKRPARAHQLLAARDRWTGRPLGGADFEQLVADELADPRLHPAAGVGHGRIEAGLLAQRWPLPNVWVGTSIESERYTFRLHPLTDTPAAVRFVSLEPLLGPIGLGDLRAGGDRGRGHTARWVHTGCCCTRALARTLDWVIIGGESGPSARPPHPDWVRQLRDQTTAAGVPLFFKQWGSWVPYQPDPHDPDGWVGQDGQHIHTDELPAALADGRPARGWWRPHPGDVVYRRTPKTPDPDPVDGHVWAQLPQVLDDTPQAGHQPLSPSRRRRAAAGVSPGRLPAPDTHPTGRIGSTGHTAPPYTAPQAKETPAP